MEESVDPPTAPNKSHQSSSDLFTPLRARPITERVSEASDQPPSNQTWGQTVTRPMPRHNALDTKKAIPKRVGEGIVIPRANDVSMP